MKYLFEEDRKKLSKKLKKIIKKLLKKNKKIKSFKYIYKSWLTSFILKR